MKDTETFSELMLRYRGLLFSVCRRYSRDGLEVDCHWLTNCQRMSVADILARMLIEMVAVVLKHGRGNEVKQIKK